MVVKKWESTPVADMVHEGHAPSPNLTGDVHGSGACGSGASGIGAIGQAPSPSHQAKGVIMGHAPSPSERVTLDDAGDIPAHLHGSGAGVGSGAGDGRTSSPEQMLKWRHYETNDDLMWRFASDDDSVSVPLGLSSPHDGYLVGNPRDGHHEAMTSLYDGHMPMTMLFPGRTVMDEGFAHENHAQTP